MTRAAPESLPLSEIVALGLISERPRHGYEIEEQIVARRLRDWTPLGRSLVYDVLRRLRGRGWVAVRDKASRRGPAAEECRLSPPGRRALATAVESALARELRDPARTEIALMFSAAIGKERVLAALDVRRTRAKADLATSRRVRAAMRRAQGAPWSANGDADPLGAVREAIFGHFERLCGAEITWSKETRARLLAGAWKGSSASPSRRTRSKKAWPGRGNQGRNRSTRPIEKAPPRPTAPSRAGLARTASSSRRSTPPSARTLASSSRVCPAAPRTSTTATCSAANRARTRSRT